MPDLPNIYAWKNYKLLIAIPVTLLLLSGAIVMLKGIPQGIDLRGGILITTETNSTLDSAALHAALTSQLGVEEVTIKTAPGTAGGTGVEVEIEQNANLAQAEIGLRNFYDAYVAYNSADLSVVRINQSIQSGNMSDNASLEADLAAAVADRAAAKAKIDAAAGAVASGVRPFIGEINSSSDDPNLLKNNLAQAYADAKSLYRDRVLSILHANMAFTDFTYEDVSPSLSEFFLQKTIQVIAASFVLTTIIVFLVFRSFVPSLAVILGAFSDIAIALGAMSLFNVPLTLASVGALLMLMGFSLDTDMLLTVRIMKRTEGRPSERAFGAMKTGLLMTFTSVAAFGLLLALAVVTQLSTYYQIAAVVMFGLFGDVIATWCTNAVIVLWNVERMQGKAFR